MHASPAVSAMRRTLALAVAAAAFVAGLALAWSHPLSPTLATATFVATALACWRYPQAWLWTVPALLPILALAPWSGALAGEELDLLVLAIVTGTYAAPRPADDRGLRAAAPLGVFLILAFGASWAIGLWRGLDDAGAAPGGWLDGYHDPGNTLRIAKSALWAALLLPPWRAALRRSGDTAGARLALGVAMGLVLAGLVVVAERAAFAGLANFSTDYRVTGPFWEMHTGGAALDGYLALALPWIAWLAVRARRPWQALVCAAAAALGYYVALVTFSRAVYLAVPVGLAAFALVYVRQARGAPSSLARDAPSLAAMAVVAAAIAWLAFRHGGYRTLAAVLGVVAATLALAPSLRATSPGTNVKGAVLGAVVGLPAIAIALAVPKGPYALFALSFAACALLAREAQGATPLTGGRVAAALAFLSVTAVAVGWHWGGSQALREAAIAVAIWFVLAAVHASGPRSLAPETLRVRAAMLAVAVGMSGVVAVMSGGDYMSGRLSSARADLDARMRHWSDTLSMLATPTDWLLGHGFGRFPARYLFHVPDGPHPGSHRVTGDAGRSWLVLAGPRHSASFGEMLRVGQWVPMRAGRDRVSLLVRAEREATLHVELCDRHLLYNGECAIAKHAVKPAGASWQRVSLTLDTRRVPARRWGLPNDAFFALAVESERGRVDIAEVSLKGADGDERIANGTFDAGVARWFTISERHHLPWHAKSLALNVLFEQGLVGLGLFAALAIAALWRVSFGGARRHPLAPALAASLAGFLVVGLFDSLLDAPRVALLFWLLLFAAVTLPPTPRGAAASARA